MAQRPPWVLLLVLPLSAWAGEPSADGLIARFEGHAEIHHLGRETLAPVTGGPLHPRDHLVTGPDGRVEITFADDTRLILGADGELVLDGYRFEPEGEGGDALFRLKTGALFVTAGRIAEQKGGAVVVRTPVASIGVRGTEFWTGPKDGNQAVLLLSGKVVVENKAGQSELTQPGQGVTVTAPEPPLRPSDFADDAADWSGPDVPLARGGTPSPPAPWNPDAIEQALKAVSFGN